MSTELNQIYRCKRCGNVVEVVHAGGGSLSCCGEEMQLLKENTQDAAVEKHVPVVTREDGGWRVTVGEVLHPMGDEHYIPWIELIADGQVYRKNLTPADTPQAFFPVNTETASARAWCNLHGLWKA
jgi:superoxide reductase